jgi:hypothetical protein
MKHFIFCCLLTVATIHLQAQCTISGPAAITVGQSASYSIPALAQCSECYDWDVVSGNVSISGSDQNNSVTVNANGAGSFQLRITWFDEDGCHQCTWNGSAIIPCDVTQDGIVFANLLGDGNLKFYTLPSLATGGPNSFTYEWTFTYADNTTSWSYDREPYIPVPCDNPVKYAHVKVSSSVCSKEIDKHWTPGICGTGGLTAAKTGTNDARAIAVSPNPASSVVNFTGKNLSQCTVSVFDRMGNIVVQKASLTRSLDIAKLKSGVYIYLINGPDGYIQKGQFIKQ